MTVSGSVAQQSSGVLLNATPKDKSRRPDRSNAMSDSQFGCLTFSFDSWPHPYTPYICGHSLADVVLHPAGRYSIRGCEEKGAARNAIPVLLEGKAFRRRLYG